MRKAASNENQNFAGVSAVVNLGSGEVILTGITITTPPAKTAYYEEDSFDPSGMVVTAAYSNGTSQPVTGYTFEPDGKLSRDTTAIVVSYTEGGVTKTAEQEITVTALEILGYYADENDTALTTTASVAYGTSEADALAKLSSNGYAKLNNGKYYLVTIQWDFDSTYDGSVSGTKAVTGTVTGELPAGLIPENQTGSITVAQNSGGGGGGGGGSASVSYTIQAQAGDGGSISPSGKVSVSSGGSKTFTITADEGYVIADVLVDGESVGAVDSYTFEQVKAGHTISVTFAEQETVADPDDTGVSDWLNTADHMAYLAGYGGGLFGPNDNMTRSQAAQMFYNLLLDQDVPVTVSFTDVPADAWYAEAVNTLASLGMVNGIGGGKFDPDRAITRAEFTVIAMRFAQLDTGGENVFSDVSADDWFYDQVVGSIQYGWINGYTDGTFRPNNTIARAEVTAIVNRMLARSADQAYADRHADELTRFTDVSTDYWAYYQIVEATNSHNYTVENGVEHWVGQTE